MKRVLFLAVATTFAIGTFISPVLAGGDKVQHEIGAQTAPGPGDDAQGNQVGGD